MLTLLGPLHRQVLAQLLQAESGRFIAPENGLDEVLEEQPNHPLLFGREEHVPQRVDPAQGLADTVQLDGLCMGRLRLGLPEGLVDGLELAVEAGRLVRQESLFRVARGEEGGVRCGGIGLNEAELWPGSAEGNTSARRALLPPLRGSVHKTRITGGLRPRLNPLRPLGAKRRVSPRARPF